MVPLHARRTGRYRRLEMTTDAALLEAWRSGDREAGNRLFSRYFSPLYRFFIHKTPDRTDDLIQETLLACVRGTQTFRGDSSFKTYLFGIAVNVLKAEFRSRSRAQAMDFGVTSVADIAPTPSQLAAQRQERGLLLEALKRIPVDCQVAIELHYFHGFRGPEIASVLDVAEGTVRSRLRRGLARLREAFQGMGVSNDAFGDVAQSIEDAAREAE